MTPAPRPGSADALAQGCRCPVIDNHHGKGAYGDGAKYGWIKHGDCPMHGANAATGKDDR